MESTGKIGVGIVTCSRPKLFKQLLESVMQNSSVSAVAVVKNKDFDYGEADPARILPECTTLEPRDVGVGACKNIAAKKLLDSGCSHIFLIEDDVKIKNCSVFTEYVKTAREFNIEHLNFGHTYD